ncbi:hypothetical protein OSB04_013617 [Centaurea solstitialis]|uniref:X8 domain-containing protein n=1 Tax=Centaurea solstitialis TaxID=347529 RepID=A0AA38TDM2_9ASTR|nr:hypothetical protein OSB04_013617 [Centaurea solstitialis]
MSGGESVIWVLLGGLFLLIWSEVVEGIGVNWGTMATHKMDPKTVVQMLKDNGINKVKLFDAEQSTMSALAGSGIEVMIAIPNDQLLAMNDYGRAKKFVQRNVTRYNFNGGVNIKYVAVGNEPFLKAYNGSFMKTTFPALQNIQNALNEAGVGDVIKATVPSNADVYGSPTDNPVPSAGTFRADINDQMTELVNFLARNNAPFTVNIYPFLSLYGNDNFPVDYAFFEAWHNRSSITGSKDPAPPGAIEVIFSGLSIEDAKSIAPGSFERHWGIFRYDGQPKFAMDISGRGQNAFLVPARERALPREAVVPVQPGRQGFEQARGEINYACTFADCTPLGYGSSCNGLDANANASYAFKRISGAEPGRDGV